MPRTSSIIASLIAILAALAAAPVPGRAEGLPSGFVRLADIDASIRQDMRYAGADNFVGRRLAGYEAPTCILTDRAAKALARVQQAVAAEGLSLVVFDCYRPERAVADMVRWARQGGPADPRWFPAVRREHLISAGYVGARSAHSRGSTVDLALVKTAGGGARAGCGAAAPGMAEFGTGFDCFDRKSRTLFSPLPPGAAGNRARLVSAMAAEGFVNYSREWWHFTLSGEPFPTRRFDFPVSAE
ncbi:MAG TPA: M15 family metallopeptidase [Rhizobiales bacterium]|nr:M15 family metallopeptidase [Hyphomicrobiales bacterium]